MKKTVLSLALLSIIFGMGLAENQCPFGMTDCPAPGQCGRYIDRNGDDICDLSQDLSQSGGASEGEQADDPQNGDQAPAGESTENNQADLPGQGSELDAQPEPQNVPETAPEDQPESMTVEQPEGKPLKFNRPNYHPWLLLLMVSVLAIAGEIWQRRDSKKIVLIQTAWNWMLLVSFLACSLTGLYFILPPGSRPAITFNVSYWHAVTGLIFIYIGLYHAIRRAACLVRGAKTCVKKTPCC
ncbi:MAG: hypothetical protein KJ620_03875 [Candidatus Edwardsbacteria bacterium]|nr:hypothetical protein [Candidatus Edwardsbacteria bacterium]MBU1577776.1 hypothetical protein [Candidatus Edwardsbacteria bacterium]MBU2462544.1 hypothetical protein [Candidatus Edwardsbacteria bacterium]MBU2595041.1 hypothetical protein [Candidatus Edwardsbacteria bacterium]